MNRRLVVLACMPSMAAHAVDRLVLQADSVQYGSTHVTQPHLTVELRSTDDVALDGTATSLAIVGLAEPARNLSLQCASATLGDPWWMCRGGAMHASQPALGALSLPFDLRWQRLESRLTLDVKPVPLAGGTASASVSFGDGHWRLDRAQGQIKLTAMRALVQPWWALPAGLGIDGSASFALSARGTESRVESSQARITLTDVNLQNEAGTVVGEHVGAVVETQIQGNLQGLQASVRITGTAGQALAGPVLLNLAANPLDASVRATLDPRAVQLEELELQALNMLHLHGSARLQRVPALRLGDAEVIVDRLQFPAAYTSLLQLSVATGILGNLETRGSASAHVMVSEGVWRSIDAQLDDLALDDRSGRASLIGLAGAVHWRPAGAPAVASELKWEQLRAFGIEAGAAELRLLAQGRDLSLQQPMRVPVFDGALNIHRVSGHAIGTADTSVDFDAELEPISMKSWSQALGWPEMAGSLSGRIPGLHYQQGALVLDGDLTANVFDGRITVGKLRWRDPFGPFTQVSGDVVARNLDLDLITRAFPIGSITGRLDADVRGLELFNWSAVAFDAQLQTTPGDRSRHRISQRAVGSIANIGGTGGGVMAALQSGFLRFFDDFGYDRIGLHCQLRNDVCLMDGIPRAGGGFYIVKGGGLPRIDIVGTQGRVAWAQVVGQISSAIASGGVIVR